MKRWLLSLGVAVLGCGGNGAALQPHEAGAKGEAERASACVAADALRVHAATLASAGKVARARAVLTQVDAQCPSEAGRIAELRKAVDEALASDGRPADAWIDDARARLAAGDVAGAQRLFDRARLAFEAAGTPPRVVDLAFEDGVAKVRWWKHGIAAAHGDRVTLRDPATLSVVRVWELDEPVTALEVEDDRLIAASAHHVFVFDAKSGARELEIAGHGAPIALRGGVLVATDTTKAHAVAAFDATHAFAKLRTFAGGSEAVTAVALSPRAKNAAIVRESGVVVLAISTGETVRTFDDRYVTSVAFGATGDDVVLGRTYSMTRRSLGESSEAINGYPKRTVEEIAVHGAGNAIATAGTLTVRLWNAKTLEPMNVDGSMKGHQDGIESVVFSPDGKLLLTGAKDRTLRVWDPNVGKAIRTVSLARASAPSIATGANELAFSSSDGAARLDLARGDLLQLGTTSASPIAIDGVRTFVAEPFSVFDASGKEMWTTMSGGTVARLVVADDDVLAYVRGVGLSRFALANGKNEGVLHHGPTSAISRDGRLALVWSSTSERARILDTQTKTSVEISALMGHDVLARSVFSKDGSLLFVPYAFPGSVERRRFRAVDTKTGQKVWEGDRTDFDIDDLALSPDGATLLVARSDRSVELWDVEKRERVARFSASSRVIDARITDAHVILSTSDGRLALHARSGKLLLARTAFSSGGAVWMDAAGHFDAHQLEGTRRAALGCVVGTKVHPLELCEDRWATTGLVEKTLRGERIDG